MGVSADDRVSGQIVAATIPPIDENDKGPPQLVVPDSLAGRVRVQEYKQDGYVAARCSSATCPSATYSNSAR